MLFHKSLGFPKGVSIPRGKVIPIYTNHAKEEAMNDRFGMINLPTMLDLSIGDAVEVEMRNGKLYKVVYRFPYNHKFDLSVALVTDEDVVKTVWLNTKDFQHKPNIKRYSLP